MNVPASATPFESVLTVIVLLLFEKVPLAPDPGAVNVTGVLAITAFEPSFTVTLSGVAKAVPVLVLWLFPLVTVTDAGVCTTAIVVASLAVAEPAALPPDNVTLGVRLVAALDAMFSRKVRGLPLPPLLIVFE